MIPPLGDSNDKFPYPMWVTVCDTCGPTHTLWEKPGTKSPYIEHCPSCGSRRVRAKRVDSGEEHKEVMETY